MEYINKNTGYIISKEIYDNLNKAGKESFVFIKEDAIKEHFDKLINSTIDSLISDLQKIKEPEFNTLFNESEYKDKLKSEIDNIFNISNEGSRFKIHLELLVENV